MTLERAETLVARAQEVFETTVEVLQDTVRTLKAMPESGEREVMKDVRAMNSALQWPWTCRRKPVSQVARILAAELARASTLAPPGRKSALDSLASGTPRDETAFLDTLSENALAALAWLFEFWALAASAARPRATGGHGSSSAGAARARRGPVRNGCGRRWKGGPGGCGHRASRRADRGDLRPGGCGHGQGRQRAVWPVRPRTGGRAGSSSERRLVWPNGAEARVYSANDPEALRGPQFDCAWADEFRTMRCGGGRTSTRDVWMRCRRARARSSRSIRR
jgi:hypothetical protein